MRSKKGELRKEIVVNLHIHKTVMVSISISRSTLSSQTPRLRISFDDLLGTSAIPYCARGVDFQMLIFAYLLSENRPTIDFGVVKERRKRCGAH